MPETWKPVRVFISSTLKGMSRTKAPVVVVAGDVAVNWLIHSGINWLERENASPVQSSSGNSENRIPKWKRDAGTLVLAREGGALLLARVLESALGGSTEAGRVVTYDIGDLGALTPADIVHSYSEVELFPAGGHDGYASVVRVGKTLGFNGPAITDASAVRIPDDSADPDAVVLLDGGNGFRHDMDAWPVAVREAAAKSVFVLQLGRDISDNPLLQHLAHSRPDRLVVIVDADDLRAEGISISRCISWERTAREVVWQFQHNSDLHSLAALPSVVVRLGLEGAVHFTSTAESLSARLYYDPLLAEGQFCGTCEGGMIGSAEAFTAALTARLVREGPIGLGEGIRDGVRSARRFIRAGFGPDFTKLEYPGAEVFAPPLFNEDFIADAEIPVASASDSADPDFWCLLNQLSGRGLERLAHQILLGDERGLRTVPLGRFGDLRTVDRAEIESYSSIRNLISQYLMRRDTKRPLCLAVFGPPGSGKSFGVEQVAKSIAGGSGARVEKLEFNMSQFETTRSLVSALHKVRDEAVKGRVPLVFFDEFDSFFGSPLGWLRYFLAPMQDGAFRDGDAVHPVGKAIFVFAGGLSETFARFSRTSLPESITEADRASELLRFREAKGPDFVSRLRGFVDVKGPNPDPTRPDDRFHLIRRAMIARSLLERNWSALRNSSNPRALNIEDAVVRALVGVPAYRHGVRSIEAVLEMSMLDGRTEFDPAALPPPEQLDQHVDADAFARLVLQGVLFAAAREAIAQAIHERYLRNHADDKEQGAVVLRQWPELPEVYRKSNRSQADDMIRKLEALDCGYRPMLASAPKAFSLSKAEIEQLAEMEHDRWMKERVDAGYSPGPVRNDERKTHPDLVAWSALSDEARQYDRDTVAAIPEFMAEAGFEVYRL